MRSPSLIFLGKFVIYTFCAGVILSLRLHYIWVCIVIFVHNITVSALIFLCMLYGLIFGCTSYLVFCHISSIYGLFFHCIVATFIFLFIFLWILYLFLLLHVGVLRTIFSLVVIHLGNLAMHTSCIWFLCHFTILVEKLRWHLFVLISCQNPWNTYLCSWFINISYIFISITFLCCFLLLGCLFILNLQHFKSCNQHHLYNLFEKIPIF